MFATVVLFPIAVRKLGALGLFRLLTLSYPILYFVTPYLIVLPHRLRMVGVYLIIIWKCTFANFAFPANAILLTNSAPSLLLLGTINGVAASTASLSRALGPTISGFLYSVGLQIGYAGLMWWFTSLVSIIGIVLSMRMEEKGGRLDEKIDDQCDIEAFHIECPSEDDLVLRASIDLGESIVSEEEALYEAQAHVIQ